MKIVRSATAFLLISTSSLALVSADGSTTSCPEGELPVSVVGVSGTYCAKAPICKGFIKSIANCPPAQAGIETGTECRWSLAGAACYPLFGSESQRRRTRGLQDSRSGEHGSELDHPSAAANADEGSVKLIPPTTKPPVSYLSVRDYEFGGQEQAAPSAPSNSDSEEDTVTFEARPDDYGLSQTQFGPAGISYHLLEYLEPTTRPAGAGAPSSSSDAVQVASASLVDGSSAPGDASVSGDSQKNSASTPEASSSAATALTVVGVVAGVIALAAVFAAFRKHAQKKRDENMDAVLSTPTAVLTPTPYEAKL